MCCHPICQRYNILGDAPVSPHQVGAICILAERAAGKAVHRVHSHILMQVPTRGPSRDAQPKRTTRPEPILALSPHAEAQRAEAPLSPQQRLTP